MSNKLKTNNESVSTSSSSGTDISDEQEIITKPESASAKNRTKSSKLKNDTTNKGDSKEVKKKKKKKSVSICLTNCRYEVIRKVAQKFGLKEVADSENWNLYWTDLSISIERCKEMKRFQRINHFPGNNQ